MFHRATTKYVCGIDLHAKKTDVMDLSGLVVAKGRVPCRIEAVMDLLARYVGGVMVGVESTYNWYWLWMAVTIRLFLTGTAGHRTDSEGRREPGTRSARPHADYARQPQGDRSRRDSYYLFGTVVQPTVNLQCISRRRPEANV